MTKLTKKYWLGLCLLLGLLVILLPSQTATAADKQTLNVQLSHDLISLDSAQATDQTSFDIMENAFEGLYRLDKDKIVPALANRAPVRHGQTYTITLRKNAKWDNGQSVSAQDFVVGFQRLADPKNDANMSFLLKNFKNYNAIQTGAKKVSTLGVKATGKHTLKITLATPISNLAELLTAPSFMPVNTKAVVQFGANYGKSSATTVYNGPFTVNNWDGKSNTFTLVKNPQYWAKKTIHLQQINFIGGKNTADAVTLFQNKQLDVANISGAVAKDWQHNKAYATHKNGTVWYLAVNQKRAALKNAAIRRALSMAINRKEMIQIALQNQATPALGLTATGFEDPNTKADFTKDVSRQTKAIGTKFAAKTAQTYWQQGLSSEKINGLTLNLLTDDADADKAVAAYIQQALQHNLPGAKINLKVVPYKTRLQRSFTGNFDLVLTSWQAPYPDPWGSLAILVSDNNLNVGHWRNVRYDVLMDGLKTTATSKQRYQNLAQAQQILLQDQGIIPLYEAADSQLVNTKVKGLTAGVDDFRTVSIAK